MAFTWRKTFFRLRHGISQFPSRGICFRNVFSDYSTPLASSRGGEELFSHLTVPGLVTRCTLHCISWCSTQNTACPRGAAGTMNALACSILLQQSHHHGLATCFRHRTSGGWKPMWCLHPLGPWQASAKAGDPERWDGVSCV